MKTDSLFFFPDHNQNRYNDSMKTDGMTLEKTVRKYYLEYGYNCRETILHAGNEYYGLGLHEEDMKLRAGFGSGMYSGSTCGALIGSVSVLSKMIVRTKAHDHLDELRPIISGLYRRFRQTGGGVTCAELRPVYHTKETKCLNTFLLAARVLEESVNEFSLF